MLQSYFDNYIIQIIAATITSIGFGIMVHVRGASLVHSGIAGGLSWGVYLFCKNINIGIGMTYFLSTLAFALYSEIVALKIKVPVISILIPALVPLAPGSGVYNTLYSFLNRHYVEGLEYGINTFIMGGAMAVGIFIGGNIIKILKFIWKFGKNKGVK